MSPPPAASLVYYRGGFFVLCFFWLSWLPEESTESTVPLLDDFGGERLGQSVSSPDQLLHSWRRSPTRLTPNSHKSSECSRNVLGTLSPPRRFFLAYSKANLGDTPGSLSFLALHRVHAACSERRRSWLRPRSLSRCILETLHLSSTIQSMSHYWNPVWEVREGARL